MSLHRQNRRGPRTNPWGTPVTSWCALDLKATPKDLPERQDSKQWSGVAMMSTDERVGWRIWWLTVWNAADISSRLRTDDLNSAFPIHRVSVTDSKAVPVEWLLLKPDWFLFSWLFFERQRWYLVENNLLKSFLYKWEVQDRSATVYT